MATILFSTTGNFASLTAKTTIKYTDTHLHLSINLIDLPKSQIFLNKDKKRC